MDIKDKPFRHLADGGTETSSDSLLKQRISAFLINYFNYFTLALAFIIFAVGCFLFVYPRYQQIFKDDEIIKKNLQIDYKNKDNYLSTIRDLKKSYQLISAAERKKIEEMTPVSDKNIWLIPEIESIVLKNGAVLDSIEMEENFVSQPKAKIKVEPGKKLESPAGIFEKLPEKVGLTRIEINLSSVSYPVLKNLLKSFENSLWLMDVATIDYDAQENKAVLTIYSYYLPD